MWTLKSIDTPRNNIWRQFIDKIIWIVKVTFVLPCEVKFSNSIYYWNFEKIVFFYIHVLLFIYNRYVQFDFSFLYYELIQGSKCINNFWYHSKYKILFYFGKTTNLIILLFLGDLYLLICLHIFVEYVGICLLITNSMFMTFIKKINPIINNEL